MSAVLSFARPTPTANALGRSAQARRTTSAAAAADDVA